MGKRQVARAKKDDSRLDEYSDQELRAVKVEADAKALYKQRCREKKQLLRPVSQKDLAPSQAAEDEDLDWWCPMEQVAADVVEKAPRKRQRRKPDKKEHVPDEGQPTPAEKTKDEEVKP